MSFQIPENIRTRCIVDQDCTKEALAPVGDKAFTGKCLNSSNPKIPTCEVYGWCPRPDPAAKTSQTIKFRDVENLKVTIENFISFPTLGSEYAQENADLLKDADYFQNCIHNEKTDNTCPVFRVHQILENAGYNYTSIARLGTMVRILITWNCDFDLTKTCPPPKYSFQSMESKKHPRTFV